MFWSIFIQSSLFIAAVTCVGGLIGWLNRARGGDRG